MTRPTERSPLYTADLAAAIKAGGDKHYRPSNGSEGDMFMERWCEYCEKDAKQGCPILAASFSYDADEPEYPEELTFDANGQPCCTAFEKRKP